MSHTQGAAPSGPRDARPGEEHHSAGSYVDDEIDGADDRGQRWYQLRPEPRLRTDFMGFNSRYWMALGWFVLLLVVAFPFPWWGW
jgi:hypothetical protein